MGDHVPDGSDECATDPALTTQDRRWRRGSGGVRPVDEGSEALVGGVPTHAPDRDTLNMCWPVVNAVLNDLTDSQPNTA